MSVIPPAPSVVDDVARIRRSLATVRTLLDELEVTPHAPGWAPGSWRSTVASQLADELDAVADALRALAATESVSAPPSATSTRGPGAAREPAARRTATR